MTISSAITTAVRAIYIVTLLVATACSDGGTAPIPAATLSIAPPSAAVYASDVVDFDAVYRDVTGKVVANAPVAWSVSDSTRAELGANGIVTALKAGTVRITARSNGVVATYDLVIAALAVERVIMLPAVLTLDRGDITPIGVKVEGQGARNVTGRVVTLSSDNPSVAAVDASGRVRAVNPGVTTVRAVADGVTGTMQVTVAADEALLLLSRNGGARLPMLVDTGTVTWNGVTEFHEIYLEAGSLKLSGSTQPRYEMDIRFAEYNAATVNGRRTLELRLVTREYDRGVIAYDPRGDLLMTSEYIHPLAHTASPISGGFQVRFRIPGTDEIRDLFYRREPK